MTDIDRLTRALEQWKCPSCGGTGNYLNKSFATGAYQESTVPCSKCGGLGLHPIAAEALAHPPQANSANEDALEAYRAAIRWVAADSWDGCSDCIKILQMARSLDEFDWTPDQHAKALKRLYDRSGGEPFAQANNAPPTSSGVEVTQADRDNLSHHEQMIDAQKGCVPCKLCGGSAVISDAGCGAGYYIRCENGNDFRKSNGCLIADQRLGGWAYNVMDWWNRLHRTTQTAELTAEVERLREALFELAIVAGGLVVATDGHESLRGPRVAVLASIKAARAALGQPS